MKALPYIRVSKDRNGDKISPEAQLGTIVGYCEPQDWDILEPIYDLDVPGGDFDRPGWQRAKESDADVIVVTEMSRYGRTVREALNVLKELHDEGKDVVSVRERFDTTTAMGDAMMKISLVFAELERNLLGERMQEVHHRLAVNGSWRGGPLPLGYEYVYDGDTITGVRINEAEAAIVRRIFALRDEGLSYTAIADELNEAQVPTKRGGKWHASTVRKIRNNPDYVGERHYNGETYSLTLPRII